MRGVDPRRGDRELLGDRLVGHVTWARVRQIMNLLNLPPDIQEALGCLGWVSARDRRFARSRNREWESFAGNSCDVSGRVDGQVCRRDSDLWDSLWKTIELTGERLLGDG